MNAREVNQELQAKKDLIELSRAVVRWWEQNKDAEIFPARDLDEEVLYSEKPGHVELAERALQTYQEKKNDT